MAFYEAHWLRVQSIDLGLRCRGTLILALISCAKGNSRADTFLSSEPANLPIGGPALRPRSPLLKPMRDGSKRFRAGASQTLRYISRAAPTRTLAYQARAKL